MRVCYRCQEKKPVNEFHKDSKGPGGYASSCKLCRNSRRNEQEKNRRKEKGIVAFQQAEEAIGSFERASEALKKNNKQLVTQIIVDTKSLANFDQKVKKHIPITSDPNIFQNILAKYQCHYSINCDKEGHIRLTTHGNPQQTFRYPDSHALMTEFM